MRRPRLRSPSPAMAVSVLALFLALTGSVVAATKLARNSVGSSEIKNKSIKGGDIANDAVSGVQLDEESLGVVPRAATAGTATAATAAKTADRAGSAATADRAGSAATADRAGSAATADRATSAGDADRLGGKSASDFARSGDVFTVSAKLEPSDPPKVLVERDGVRLVARCLGGVATTSGGVANVFTIQAESDADGATLLSPRNKIDGSSGVWLGPATADSARLAVQEAANVGARVVRFPDGGDARDSVKGITLSSVGGTTIFVGTGAGIRVSFGLLGATCAVVAPVLVAAP
ncbi:MAG: hypothetical protein JHD16_02090 [Solirubrobacteraceae bacterium]|nr:hypothetical protein [Solirubrobacteraceae bacterium]